MGKILPRKLSEQGLTLPPIGQGTMGIGGYYKKDSTRDVEWIAGLRRGIDLGLTLLDSAEVYGAGHSEELVGEAIRGIRDQVFLSTKFSAEHSRASQVITAAEQSLRRLRTDHIDFYQPHWPNPSVPFEETAEALEILVQSGKVRFVGLSNFSYKEAQQATAILDPIPVPMVQQEYNLIDRTIEDHILPDCRNKKALVLAYSPLLQGKLVPKDERRTILKLLAEKYQRTVSQIILAWLLRDDSVVVIPKGTTGSHLVELAMVQEISLELEDIQKISQQYETRVSKIPLSQISVQGGGYLTLQEAQANHLGFDPSPRQLAQSILDGKMLKPIKIKKVLGHDAYVLTEGKIRFWAWALAYDLHSCIPAFVEKCSEAQEILKVSHRSETTTYNPLPQSLRDPVVFCGTKV